MNMERPKPLGYSSKLLNTQICQSVRSKCCGCFVRPERLVGLQHLSMVQPRKLGAGLFLIKQGDTAQTNARVYEDPTVVARAL